ncbi:MAG: endopeptidase La [Balneolales bacterium]
MIKEKENKINQEVEVLPTEVGVLPLRDTVIYPNTMFPILVGRPNTLAAVNDAMSGNRYIILCAQKDGIVEDPGKNDIYTTGTLAQIVQVLRLPNDLLKVLVSGHTPAQITRFIQGDPFMKAEITHLNGGTVKVDRKLEALIRKTREQFEKYVMINQDLPEEILLSFEQNDDPRHLLFFMASYIDMDIDQKQKLLEHKSLATRYKSLLTRLTAELDLLAVSTEINDKVQDEIQETQRKFYIQEQIKVLQDELDDEGGFSNPELAKIKNSLDELELPKQALEKTNEELERLRKTPQMSPEYSVARNYLDWIIAMPWNKYSKDKLEIKIVEDELNRDHFGLEKPKERILEHIAVLNMVREMKGQILCFVGPPGTGKTSLAKSIAQSLGREMVRISLGGISDEAEIRGHRKTYIGSMPGRIIQSIKKAGTMNPVIILDEIDKLGNDYRGDPSSAVLEVLDPEQNNFFNDHYLDLDFDLSQVMFITTANVASQIQPPLLDRMEIINLPGYLEHDKLEIARRHLLPKQLKAHGLTKTKVKFKDDALMHIIRKYTMEAGVRTLEQQIAAVCRKVAKKIVINKAMGKKTSQITINKERIVELLGVEKFRDRDLDKKDKIGAINGLAWTSTGGSMLQIEVAKMHGKNKFILTGQLGDVMKESAQAALTYLRSNSSRFKLDDDFFEKNEIHIHLPEGAIPKDGPSAGMGMALAMISLVTNREIRYDVAITGEITLSGEVYAIGGLNEKLLAAQRNQIKTVLIPKDNERDLSEIPDKVKKGLTIISVNHIEDAIPNVFRRKLP